MIRNCTKYAFGSHSKFAVIGGGTGGLNFVTHLKKEGGVVASDIRVFEPNKQHYYQPGWTMVAGGIYDMENTVKMTRDVIPEKVPITELAVTKVDPKNNTIITEDGDKYTYDHLIISTGISTNFHAVKGAVEALEDPDCPVGSAYDKKYAVKMQNILKDFQSGDFVFQEAPMPIKCAGAPQKVAFLSECALRKAGKREQTKINFYMAKGVVFGVPKYAEVLKELHAEKNINIHLNQKMVEVDKDQRLAIFENTQTGIKTQKKFDALHMVPHQVAPKFISESGLADAGGFVDVDKNTLQHVKYNNIWSLGDSSSLPTSKTAAAIFSQTPILIQNLMAQINKPEVGNYPGKYEGYTSCPILIGGNRLVLAEFKYDAVVDETFPIDQGKPQGFFFRLKKDVFPFVYWNLVPRGLWYGRNHILPNIPGFRTFVQSKSD